MSLYKQIKVHGMADDALLLFDQNSLETAAARQVSPGDTIVTEQGTSKVDELLVSVTSDVDTDERSAGESGYSADGYSPWHSQRLPKLDWSQRPAKLDWDGHYSKSGPWERAQRSDGTPPQPFAHDGSPVLKIPGSSFTVTPRPGQSSLGTYSSPVRSSEIEYIFGDTDMSSDVTDTDPETVVRRTNAAAEAYAGLRTQADRAKLATELVATGMMFYNGKTAMKKDMVDAMTRLDGYNRRLVSGYDSIHRAETAFWNDFDSARRLAFQKRLAYLKEKHHGIPLDTSSAASAEDSAYEDSWLAPEFSRSDEYGSSLNHTELDLEHWLVELQRLRQGVMTAADLPGGGDGYSDSGKGPVATARTAKGPGAAAGSSTAANTTPSPPARLLPVRRKSTVEGGLPAASASGAGVAKDKGPSSGNASTVDASHDDSVHQQLTAFYAQHDPAGLQQVDSVMAQFAGNEETLVAMLTLALRVGEQS